MNENIGNVNVRVAKDKEERGRGRKIMALNLYFSLCRKYLS